MSENTNAGNGTNNGGSASGAGTQQPSNAGVTNVFDTKTISDENFDKIFDDPRVFKHPRFKNLGERAKKADELEQQMSQKEEQTLAEQKKFEELAKKRESERDDAINKYKTSLLDNAIIGEAIKIGVVDVNAVLKLVDRSRIQMTDAGPLGAHEAVEALLAASPFLKGKSVQQPIGSGTNPSGDGDGIQRFKLSQIQNPTFYREHEKEILQAMREGKVENDLS